MTPHYSAYPLMWSCAPSSLCYDMLITGDDQEGLQSLKTFLNFHFDVKDHGHLCYFMRIEVAYPQCYLLSQMSTLDTFFKEKGLLIPKSLTFHLSSIKSSLLLMTILSLIPLVIKRLLEVFST